MDSGILFLIGLLYAFAYTIIGLSWVFCPQHHKAQKVAMVTLLLPLPLLALWLNPLTILLSVGILYISLVRCAGGNSAGILAAHWPH